MKLPCLKCKKEVEIELSESGPHVKASCIECGAYIKFMSQNELEGKPMSEYEVTIKLESSKYNELVVLEKRGDDYGIALAQESQNGGTNYMKWVFPQRRVDGKNVPNEKAIPFRIPIGTRDQAVSLLLQLLAALGHPVAGKPSEDQEPPF